MILDNSPDQINTTLAETAVSSADGDTEINLVLIEDVPASLRGEMKLLGHIQSRDSWSRYQSGVPMGTPLCVGAALNGQSETAPVFRRGRSGSWGKRGVRHVAVSWVSAKSSSRWYSRRRITPSTILASRFR